MSQATLEQHNRRQRAYFEQTGKRTMRPSDTPYVQRQVAELLRFASVAPGERVLEVGCGMGRYTLPLAERGVLVEGLDLSPLLLSALRRADNGRYDIPLYCMDVLHCPPGLEGRFDAVVGFFTLHHLHDLPQSFAAMARLLRPGGRLAFLEPNPINPLYYAQIALTPRMRWSAERGLLQMRPGLVADLMRRAGLVRPALARFGAFPPLVANQPWAPPIEAAIERVPLWRPLLPFQLFRGERS